MTTTPVPENTPENPTATPAPHETTAPGQGQPTASNRSIARALRDHLCDLLLAVGPDAPTLCEGWTARDLAAHLVIRDRRPDAMPGIFVEKLASYTQSVQDTEASRPFGELVERVRTGPPKYSPMSIPALDERTNTMEFAIHVEDVRLAQPTEVRLSLPALPEGTQEAVWKALSMAGIALRRSPVAITAVDASGPERVLAKGKSSGSVRLVGRPTDILMTVSGRDGAPTRIEGSASDVAAFENLKRRM